MVLLNVSKVNKTNKKNTRCSYKVDLEPTRLVNRTVYKHTWPRKTLAMWKLTGEGKEGGRRAQERYKTVMPHAETSKYPTESCIFSQLGKLCFLILFKLGNNSVICVRLPLKVTQVIDEESQKDWKKSQTCASPGRMADLCSAFNFNVCCVSCFEDRSSSFASFCFHDSWSASDVSIAPNKESKNLRQKAFFLPFLFTDASLSSEILKNVRVASLAFWRFNWTESEKAIML